jgi:cell division protein FtsX
VLRHRVLVSLGLAVSLAVPVCLAGVSWTVIAWLGPVAEMAANADVVPVLLHPLMSEEQRQEWVSEQRAAHPEWRVEEVSPSDLAARLTRWFPYLSDLLEDDGGMLTPLIEITTRDPESVGALEGSPAVVAIGPRSSVQRTVGSSARAVGTVLVLTSAMLLLAATVFAAVWVHLELYRHSDEITIMRLVGATEPAVRGPFLFACAAPGVAAAVLAAVGTSLAVGRLSVLTASLGLPDLRLSIPVLAMEAMLACGLPLTAAAVVLSRHAAADL